MGTVRDLIASSLRALNVIVAGEAPTASMAEDARVSLNEMIEIWNTQSLMVYTMPRQIQALTAGKATYTWGTGGDWDLPRPVRLDSASFLDTASGTETPIALLTNLQFRSIRLKSTQGTWQDWLYIDYDFPLANVTLFPVPQIDNQIVLYPWIQLTQMPSLDTIISFPPGYAAALRYNLAVWLSPEYMERPPRTVGALAIDTMRAIKTINTPLEEMTFDAGLLTRYGRRRSNASTWGAS